MRPFALALTLLALVGTLSLAQDEAEAPGPSQWVEQTLDGMSLDEKVGQLIVGGSGTGYTSTASDEFERIREEIERYHLGGYHAFRGDVYSAAFLIRRMQQRARIPLLITADLEGGLGLIIEGGTRFPKAMALGAVGDPEAARTVGRITAQEARRVGIHVNFYPVVDVNNNPENPVINIRSFGEDPEAVGRMAAAYIQGVQSQGLLATAKHFPGHGDTSTDSHLELPVIEASLQRLREVELVPFRSSIEAGVAAIMTAHLAVPALEPDTSLPATLSRRILSGLLREEMGFEGLIFTDAMNMRGVANHFSDGEAGVRAVEAGADLILFPRSVGKTHLGVLQAVRSGRLSLQRIERSVRRILQAKARLGLDRYSPPDLERIDEYVGSKENQEIAQQIMESALTVVRDERKVLPLRPARNSTLLVLTLLDERRRHEDRGLALYRTLRDHHRRTIHFEIGPDAAANEVRLALALARRVGAIVVGGYIRAAALKGSTGLSDHQIRLLEGLSELDRPFAFVLFGSPYLLPFVPDLPSYILAYDDHPGAEKAAARLVLGRVRSRGKLPVSLPDLYPLGHGLNR
ncbi:MAG: glycoside hydrolase family 3 N-terminal domain-containing protein [Acidobacteriota bacterium]